MGKILSGRVRRLSAAALAAAATATLIAPTAASADIRVSPNFALLPDRNPIYGRDGLGLAVNPANQRHMVAVYADWTNLWCEVAVTQDAGITWRRSRLRAPEEFIQPPCTVGSHLSQLIDQSIAFGAGNRVYATFASASGNEEAPQGQSALVARSTNGGRSFAMGVVALRGGTVLEQGPDYTLPKLVVRAAARRSGRDRIFLVAGSAQAAHDTTAANTIVFTRSGDNGKTWSDPSVISGEGVDAIEASLPVLGRNGDLFVAWRTRNPGAQPGTFAPEGTITLGRSSDGGATWTRVPVANVQGYIYTGPTQGPFLPAGATFNASSFPRIAADRRTGNIYLVYGNGTTPTKPTTARAADHFIHPDMDVWFQASRDRGATWSEPRRLNGQPKVFTEPATQTRHPNITVAPNGRVDVVWNDRRHWYRGCLHTHLACQEARIQDIYYRSSANAGRSFGRERRITDRSLNGDIGFDYRFGSYWDYGPVSVPLGSNRLMVGWMDTRDGNVETDNMGLWLSRVNLKASKRIPAQRVAARTTTDLSVRLSRTQYPAGAEAVLAGTFASRPWTRAVIVNRNDAASALAGAVLARAFVGPVLLAPAGGLTDAVENELRRLAPVGAYVIGDEGALSSQVVTDLTGTGIPADQVVRIGRSGDLAGTVADVAMAMDRRTDADRAAGRPAFDAVMLVNPDTRDAYAAAALATHRRLPVLLTGKGEVPAATAQALQALNISKTLVVGGTSAISNAVLQQLPGAERLNGNTPVGTSRSVVLASRDRGVPENIVYAASANRRMDAALIGAAAGRMGGLLLLTDRQRPAVETLAAMGLRSRIDRIITAARASGRQGGRSR